MATVIDCSQAMPLSSFYSTNLNNVICGYSRLGERISRSLGAPLINVEIHQDQLYENISIAVEMFTKFAGFTREYIIFNSDLYERGKGIRMDPIFDVVTAVFFLLGVGLALWRWRRSLGCHRNHFPGRV